MATDVAECRTARYPCVIITIASVRLILTCGGFAPLLTAPFLSLLRPERHARCQNMRLWKMFILTVVRLAFNSRSASAVLKLLTHEMHCQSKSQTFLNSSRMAM